MTVNNPVVPPVISAVNATSITSSSATINWNTDKASDSQVAYGTSVSYGSLTTLNTSLLTTHAVNLSGLSASTVYHYQVLSRDAQGNLTTSIDNMFTTPAAPVGPQPLLLLHADASEVSGVANGSIVTPATAPPGFTGTVKVKGTGSVNFAPAQVGNGVYFLNCCDNSSGYYQFTGSMVGNIFNVAQGQVSFYLKSRYSFATRPTGARLAFDVQDTSSHHMFYFLTQVSSGSLVFSYVVGGATQYYYVPSGTQDALFGNGVVMKVTITWDGHVSKLYLNDVQVQSANYTSVTPSWSAASIFNLGANELAPYGGFNAEDDIIDEFTVLPSPIP